MNIQAINSAIIAGTLTNDELTSVIDAVKYARGRLGNQMKYQLRPGDSVQFTSSKTGRVMQGEVMKIAIKYVTVCTTTGQWRVPANMLTKTETLAA